MSTSTRPASKTVTVAAPAEPRSSVPITVTSATFSDGATLDREQAFTGCGGKNVSPQLSWSGFPAETKSFAITVFDPDAPTGSGYSHWVVFDVPARVTSLEAGAGSGASPGGGQTGFNDFALNSYAGPCPPQGDPAHRYIFTVHALDVPAVQGAGAKTTGATLMFLVRGHVLARGQITGMFAMT